jgi:integrase
MASLYKYAGGWRAQVRQSGRRPVSKVFRTREEAVKWARSVEHAGDQGKAVNGPRMRISELLAHYVETRADAGRPVQRQSNEGYMLRHLVARLGKESLAKLDTQRLVEFARARRRSGAGPYTVNMEISKLGTALRYSCSLLNISYADPVAAARPTLHHLGLIGSGRKRDRRPASDEWLALLAHFRTAFDAGHTRVPMHDVCQIAALLGLRRSELVRIEFADLDQERMVLTVRDRKHPRAKQGNDQQVPLIGNALEILLRQRKLPDQKLIFPFTPDNVSKLFHNACVELDITGLRLHDLRHEAASALFEAGWNIPEVAAVTGHQDWRHLRRYTQIDPSKLAGKPVGAHPGTPPRPAHESAASRPPAED